MKSAAVVLVVSVLAAAAAASSAGATRSPGFVGCRAYTAAQPAPTVRPRSIVAACADANLYFTGLRWSTWSASRAVGTGIAHQNDCTPNCAAGRFHTYPAHVTLTAPRACGGKRELTKLTYRFAAKFGSGSETFRCR